MKTLLVYFMIRYTKGGLVMNEVINKDYINIENLIYEIRGKQLMLDSEISATK